MSPSPAYIIAVTLFVVSHTLAWPFAIRQIQKLTGSEFVWLLLVPYVIGTVLFAAIVATDVSPKPATKPAALNQGGET